MPLKKREISDYVDRIDRFNQAWKEAAQRWGNESPFSTMLRNRKTDLQVQLIQDFPTSIRLELDNNTAFDELQVGLHLDPPIELKSGLRRANANHIPLRLLVENLSPESLPADLQGLLTDE